MKLAHPFGTDLAAWARRLVDDLNRFFPSAAELPMLTDAEATASVKVGEEYVTPDGFRKRRMT